MVQIVYASAAVKPFARPELEALLRKARSRNRCHEVSGLLVYHAGSFLQVLEGPPEGVELILASIHRDARHKRTRVLHRQTIRSREFGDLEMSFADVSSCLIRPEGLLDYQQDFSRLTAGASDARRYLRFFHEGLCRQT